MSMLKKIDLSFSSNRCAMVNGILRKIHNCESTQKKQIKMSE